MVGGPSECPEGPPVMELAGEADTEGGGGSMSVHHVLSGGGPVSPNFWGRDLVFVGGDVPEAGGVKPGIPKAYTGTESSATEGWDLEVCGRIEGP